MYGRKSFTFGRQEEEFDIKSLSFTPAPRVTVLPSRLRKQERARNRAAMAHLTEDGDTSNRAPCKFCGRKFASDRLPTHERICARSTRKRPVFNSQRQRMAGTEQAKFFRGGYSSYTPHIPRKNFRAEHHNLVTALRAARGYGRYEKLKEQGKAVGPPPPLPVYADYDDGRIQCNGCGRKFGPEQFERHSRFCSSYDPLPYKRQPTRKLQTRSTSHVQPTPKVPTFQEMKVTSLTGFSSTNRFASPGHGARNMFPSPSKNMLPPTQAASPMSRALGPTTRKNMRLGMSMTFQRRK